MDLNSALREEFDALKKSSAAHSIPHAVASGVGEDDGARVGEFGEEG